MKHILFVLWVWVLVLGCDKSDHLILRTYQKGVDEVVVSSDKIDYSFDRIDDVLNLRYCRESGCTAYLIGNKSGKYISEEGDTSDLIVDQELSYKINRTDYRVRKLLLNRNGFDSKSFHYFCPEFGIILIKAKTWRDFAILSKPADVNLNTLITVLLRDQLSTNVVESGSKMSADTLLNKEIGEELRY